MVRKFAAVAFSLAVAHAAARAERLPIRSYTTADGLVGDVIYAIRQDSFGYLWLSSPAGLSRFDGHTFLSYTGADGVQGTVRDILETRTGRLYFASDAGLLRLASQARAGRPHLEPVVAGAAMLALAEAGDGEIYAASAGGLLRFHDGAAVSSLERVSTGPSAEDDDDPGVYAVLVDSDGAVWTAHRWTLRRRANGRVDSWTLPGRSTLGASAGWRGVLFEDRSAHLWVASPDGALWSFESKPVADRPLEGMRVAVPGRVHAMIETTAGALWIATENGLALREDGGGNRFVSFGERNGLTTSRVFGLAEDRDGNLWAGTEHGGVMKLARDGFTTWGAEVELTSGIRAILEDRRGDLLIASDPARLHTLAGRKLASRSLRLDGRVPPTWGWQQVMLQDRDSAFWYATGGGLLRWDTLAGAPAARYTRRDGLEGDQVFRIFEDSRGDLWVSGEAFPAPGGRLCRKTRGLEGFHCFTAEELTTGDVVSAIEEDAAGDLWLGTFYEGALVRFRNERFESWTPLSFQNARVHGIHSDPKRRLWIATSHGLVRMDDPAADAPRARRYTSADGLSGDAIHSIVSDFAGRIYVGTRLGVDRLSPDTGTIRHYTLADGLAATEPQVAYRDHRGAIWFGTARGVSRHVPTAETVQRPPPVYIVGLRVAGEASSFPERGATTMPPLDLGPDQRNVQIDFTSIGFRAGEVLRFQTKLEGSGDDWGAPSPARSVTYARLAPGSYRFLVRAVDAEGLTSERPAVLELSIAAPFYARGWFLAAVLGAAALAGAFLHRLRARRLLELERVRATIATDLHDDIGSTLSQIAIVSEVARRRSATGQDGVRQSLETIAGSARELVDTMSDIVWAVDPRQDGVADLAQRMRRFAGDTCAGAGIALKFHDRHVGAAVLEPRVRRAAYLVFKEAINNAVKHAKCSTIEVELAVEPTGLRVRVHDDGAGIGHQSSTRGRGLANMRARSAALGGRLEIHSEPGAGTRVELSTPLRPV